VQIDLHERRVESTRLPVTKAANLQDYKIQYLCNSFSDVIVF
jgi:hypothetical protein